MIQGSETATVGSSRERVGRAYEFARLERIPRFDTFWDYPDEWFGQFGDAAVLSDMEIWKARSRHGGR
jgi:hypothetical protein